jgi:PAS domain S-box-containing protein
VYRDGWRFGVLHDDAYRTLVEGVPVILYIDRPDDRSTNLYTSPQAEAILGFSSAEWVADPDLWYGHIHPEDRERVWRADRDSAEAGERFFAEYRFRTKAGDWVWMRDEATPVKADDGRVLYWRGVMLDVTEQKTAEENRRHSLEALRRTVQQRRELAKRLEHAQEEERRRIAQDIHDDPIQVMSAVDMRLQLLASAPERASIEELVSLEEQVRGAIERLRHLLFELRPVTLDRQGLIPALQVYLDRTAAAEGWTAELVDQLGDDPVPDLRAAVYRIAQEAVTNARKHASAGAVTVTVRRRDGGIEVEVRDDGIGFDPAGALEPRPGHLGLSTIVERTELVGGRCQVRSAPGEGAELSVWLPEGDGWAGGEP